jgi:hypothetical protein
MVPGTEPSPSSDNGWLASRVRHEACSHCSRRRRTQQVTAMKQSIAELKRYPVYNRRGDKLGAIDDVVLDADDWSICYAVLRYEVPGEPHKLLGVALDALTLDSENECLVVAADDDALRRARGFDREAPPSRPEPLFRSPGS